MLNDFHFSQMESVDSQLKGRVLQVTKRYFASKVWRGSPQTTACLLPHSGKGVQMSYRVGAAGQIRWNTEQQLLPSGGHGRPSPQQARSKFRGFCQIP